MGRGNYNDDDGRGNNNPGRSYPDGNPGVHSSRQYFTGIYNFNYDHAGRQHFDPDQHPSAADDYSAGVYNFNHHNPGGEHPHPHYYFGRININLDQRNAANDYSLRPNKYGDRRRHHCFCDNNRRRIHDFIHHYFCANIYGIRPHCHLHELAAGRYLYHRQPGLYNHNYKHIARRDHHIVRPSTNCGPDLHEYFTWKYSNNDNSTGLDGVLHTFRKHPDNHRNNRPRWNNIFYRTNRHHASSDIDSRTHAGPGDGHTDERRRNLLCYSHNDNFSGISGLHK